MVCVNGQLIGRGDQSISPGLQFPAATLLDLIYPMGQTGKEKVNLVANVGGCSKASVCGHFFTNPLPDGFVRIEIWTIGGQCDQLESEVRCPEICADLRSAVPAGVVCR